MKKHFTLEEIKKIFSDPHSLKKGQKMWVDAERKGASFTKHNELKKKTMSKEKCDEEVKTA